MKRAVFLGILCAMTINGCGGQHGPADKPSAAADSARGADSTQQLPVVVPVRELSYEEKQGAFLYNRYCSVCHGEGGKGDGFNAFNLDPHPRDLSDSTYMQALGDEQIVQIVLGGGRSVNKSPLMPAYGRTLNKLQIQNVVAYVRTFSGQ